MLRSRSPLRVGKGRLLGGALLLVLGGGSALAQGQDSTTSTTASQTSPHPPPVLSMVTVTSVATGTPRPGGGLPPEFQPTPAPGLTMPGSIGLRPPAQLACADIRDPTARTRCEGLSAKPAPPKGAAP